MVSEITAPAAVLFPGQGAQVLGMGLDIAQAEPAAQRVFERAGEVLGFDLAALIAGDDKAALDRTDVCQPAILVTSLAVMAALDARGLVHAERVGACAGLSLGEYSALTWAGALTLDDAIKLVRARGQAMQAASEERSSGMLSLVGADDDKADALCDAARGDGVLLVANRLAPGQIAIAGSADAIERAAGMLRDHGIRKGVRLAVAGAFHSPCMESAAARLAEALAATELSAPRLPVVMNVSGQPTRDPDQIRDLLLRQVTSPVLWQTCMQSQIDAGVTTWLEPAPGKQLTNMLRRYDVESSVHAIKDAAALDALPPWPGDTP
ncbi:MAG: [acyl-carrier-protein] S-malonyltransferase [Planctomycetota bacterium]|nr:MAG: [acyl-carrier-protein] S-malonyltransferase [Planctomycetota bacterium]